MIAALIWSIFSRPRSSPKRDRAFSGHLARLYILRLKTCRMAVEKRISDPEARRLLQDIDREGEEFCVRHDLFSESAAHGQFSGRAESLASRLREYSRKAPSRRSDQRADAPSSAKTGPIPPPLPPEHPEIAPETTAAVRTPDEQQDDGVSFAFAPWKSGLLERVLESGAGMSRRLTPFLAEHIGWFISGLFSVAGAGFLIGHTTGPLRAVTVALVLFLYTLLLLVGGWQIARRRPDLRTVSTALNLFGILLAPLAVAAVVHLGGLSIRMGLPLALLEAAVFFFMIRLASGMVHRSLSGGHAAAVTQLTLLQSGIWLFDMLPPLPVMIGCHTLILTLAGISLYRLRRCRLRPSERKDRFTALYAAASLIHPGIVSFWHLSAALPAALPAGYFGPVFMGLSGLCFYGIHLPEDPAAAPRQWSAADLAIYGLSLAGLLLSFPGPETRLAACLMGVCVAVLMIRTTISLLPLYLFLLCFSGAWTQAGLVHLPAGSWLNGALPALLALGLAARHFLRKGILRLPVLLIRYILLCLFLLVPFHLLHLPGGWKTIASLLPPSVFIWWLMGSLPARIGPFLFRGSRRKDAPAPESPPGGERRPTPPDLSNPADPGETEPSLLSTSWGWVTIILPVVLLFQIPFADVLNRSLFLALAGGYLMAPLSALLPTGAAGRFSGLLSMGERYRLPGIIRLNTGAGIILCALGFSASAIIPYLSDMAFDARTASGFPIPLRACGAWLVSAAAFLHTGLRLRIEALLYPAAAFAAAGILIIRRAVFPHVSTGMTSSILAWICWAGAVVLHRKSIKDTDLSLAQILIRPLRTAMSVLWIGAVFRLSWLLHHSGAGFPPLSWPAAVLLCALLFLIFLLESGGIRFFIPSVIPWIMTAAAFGGGLVLADRPPFFNVENETHVFPVIAGILILIEEAVRHAVRSETVRRMSGIIGIPDGNLTVYWPRQTGRLADTTVTLLLLPVFALWLSGWLDNALLTASGFFIWTAWCLRRRRPVAATHLTAGFSFWAMACFYMEIRHIPRPEQLIGDLYFHLLLLGAAFVISLCSALVLPSGPVKKTRQLQQPGIPAWRKHLAAACHSLSLWSGAIWWLSAGAGIGQLLVIHHTIHDAATTGQPLRAMLPAGCAVLLFMPLRPAPFFRPAHIRGLLLPPLLVMAGLEFFTAPACFLAAAFLLPLLDACFAMAIASGTLSATTEKHHRTDAWPFMASGLAVLLFFLPAASPLALALESFARGDAAWLAFSLHALFTAACLLVRWVCRPHQAALFGCPAFLFPGLIGFHISLTGSITGLAMAPSLFGMALLLVQTSRYGRRHPRWSRSVEAVTGLWGRFFRMALFPALVLIPNGGISQTIFSFVLASGFLCWSGVEDKSKWQRITGIGLAVLALHIWPFLLKPLPPGPPLALWEMGLILRRFLPAILEMMPWFSLQLLLAAGLASRIRRAMENKQTGKRPEARFRHSWTELLQDAISFLQRLSAMEWAIHLALLVSRSGPLPAGMPERLVLLGPGLLAGAAITILLYRRLEKDRPGGPASPPSALETWRGWRFILAGLGVLAECRFLAYPGSSALADILLLHSLAWGIPSLRRRISRPGPRRPLAQTAPALLFLSFFLVDWSWAALPPALVLSSAGAWFLRRGYHTGRWSRTGFGLLLMNLAVYLWAPVWSRQNTLLMIYTIPAGTSLLALLQWHREEVSREALHRIRLLVLSIFYASAAADLLIRPGLGIFALSLFIGLTGLGLAHWLRIRAFLYSSSAFLFFHIILQMVRFYPDNRLGKGLLLALAGMGMMGLMIALQIKREAVLSRLRLFRRDLSDWS